MSIPSPSRAALRISAVVALALLALLIAMWNPSRTGAAHGDVLTLRATGYGDGFTCCWGSISRDGDTWERFDWRTTFSLAHISLPRGTEVCLAIPPQADAYDDHMRYGGFTTCSYPDGEWLTIADSCWLGPGQPCGRDHLDVSHGALRYMGFCRPDERAYGCLARWGAHREVLLYVWRN
jgi:hypothetical protein